MSRMHYIVDRFHVSLSDRELIRAIVRSRPKGTWRRATREARHRFLRACLKTHHDNQATYRWVMGGH